MEVLALYIALHGYSNEDHGASVVATVSVISTQNRKHHQSTESLDLGAQLYLIRQSKVITPWDYIVDITESLITVAS